MDTSAIELTPSRQLAAHLRHPFDFELKPDTLEPHDALRQIELAEANMKFQGGEAAERALARWNYELFQDYF